MPISQIIEKLEQNPKKLFFIDGAGAILSAFLLAVVIAQLEELFGIPASTLYFLAVFPVIFALYDFFSYQQEKGKAGQFLMGIAVINFLYCCLSIGMAFYHLKTISLLGWAYILGEILIVMTLAIVEFTVAQRMIAKNSL